MSTWLLAVSLGPVVPFLQATRRTRDLWAASAILSDLSRALAWHLQKVENCTLVVPASVDQLDVEAAIAVQIDVPDLVLAVTPANSGDPGGIVKRACEKATKRWEAIAEKALSNCRGMVVEDRFNAQIPDVFDYSSAWVLLANPDSFLTARERVETLLAAREKSRPFQAFVGQAGLPKSSLDGARETVWRNPDDLDVLVRGDALRKRLRLGPGEQLDAPGLAKRAGKDTRAFPSVARVAADPWVRGLRQDELERLKQACHPLRDCGLVVISNRYPAYESFPFEGSILYPERQNDFWELVSDRGEDERWRNFLKAVSPIRQRCGTPQPYFVMLAADGDRLGDACRNAKTQKRSQELSRTLSGFTSAAREITGTFQGSLVYAGGDDILAMVPLDRALECAHALRDRFVSLLKPWGGATLSVGLAAGHQMDALEDHVARAFEALDEAKQSGRNALAIHFHPRGGAPVKVVGNWDLGISERIATAIALYLDGKLPNGAAFELQQLSEHYALWSRPDKASACVADALLVLARKEMSTSERNRMAELVRSMVQVPADLGRLAGELVVARHMAPAYRQSGVRPLVVEEPVR